MAAAVETSCAYVAEKAGPFEQVTLQCEPPREDEVRVRIVATGVCHTDVAVQMGFIPTNYPIVLGHEGVGVVEDVGAEVTSLKVGDKVMMCFDACRSCENCLSGKPSYCYSHRDKNFGGSRDDGSVAFSTDGGEPVHSHFFGQSSFSTHTVVNQSSIVHLPDDLIEGIELKSLAALACGVQTGAGAVLNSLSVSAGSSIAVMGTGAVGLSSVMAAAAAGATTIIGVDLHDSRLELATELGCTHVINSTGLEHDELTEKLVEIAGRGGLDFAVDTSGVPSVLCAAFCALRPTGVAALVGGSRPGSTANLPMDKILLGRTVRGVIQGDSISKAFVPTLIQLHKQGKFPFDRLITYYGEGMAVEERLGLVQQACDESKCGSAIKPVIIVSDE